MEEKFYELMEKIYVELQNTNKKMDNGFKSVNERLDKVEDSLDKVENRLTKVEQNQVRFEQEMNRKTDLLLDGYNANFEMVKEVDSKVEYIAEKVSKSEMEIKVLQKCSNSYKRDLFK